MKESNVYSTLKTYLKVLIEKEDLTQDPIMVTAQQLTTDEAIGNPEHSDYPLIVGRERMMEALVRGAPGQAFTDMYGHWQGSLGEVADLDLNNNFRRAIFVAALNGAMRYTGELSDTRHCRDEGPVACAKELVNYVKSEALTPPFVLIGFQPRFAETLSIIGDLRIVDMDIKHIGRQRCGTTVYSPEETDRALEGAKTVFVTGTTLVNDTIHQFWDLPIPTVFYGVTIAGAAKVLGLRRYCEAGL